MNGPSGGQCLLASENTYREPAGSRGSCVRAGGGLGGLLQLWWHLLTLPLPPCLFGVVPGSAGAWYAATNWKIEYDIKLIKTALCVLIFLSSFN